MRERIRAAVEPTRLNEKYIFIHSSWSTGPSGTETRRCTNTHVCGSLARSRIRETRNENDGTTSEHMPNLGGQLALPATPPSLKCIRRTSENLDVAASERQGDDDGMEYTVGSRKIGLRSLSNRDRRGSMVS